MPKTKLLAQGSYGCVYYPGYSCSGDGQTTQYVSKLSREDSASKVEYDMGQRIKKIPHYDKRFVVIEKKCKVQKPLLEKTTDCGFAHKGKEYVLLYSKYIKSVELGEILSKHELTYYKLLQITKSLVNRIAEMFSVGVVHMDLHFGNVLWSKKDNHLYVIDFGLAMDVNQFYKGDMLNMRYLNESFMDYNPSWLTWTLEYNFLTLMIKERTGLTTDNILKTITEHYKTNNVLKKYIGKQYIQTAYAWFEPLAKNDTETNIRFFLTFANTWDYYKIAYNILYYMSMSTIPFVELKWLLLIMIHPLPTFRPTRDELDVILKRYLADYKEYKNIPAFSRKDNLKPELELTKSLKEYLSDKRNTVKENPYMSIYGKKSDRR